MRRQNQLYYKHATLSVLFLQVLIKEIGDSFPMQIVESLVLYGLMPQFRPSWTPGKRGFAGGILVSAGWRELTFSLDIFQAPAFKKKPSQQEDITKVYFQPQFGQCCLTSFFETLSNVLVCHHLTAARQTSSIILTASDFKPRLKLKLPKCFMA